MDFPGAGHGVDAVAIIPIIVIRFACCSWLGILFVRSSFFAVSGEEALESGCSRAAEDVPAAGDVGPVCVAAGI